MLKILAAALAAATLVLAGSQSLAQTPDPGAPVEIVEFVVLEQADLESLTLLAVFDAVIATVDEDYKGASESLSMAIVLGGGELTLAYLEAFVTFLGAGDGCSSEAEAAKALREALLTLLCVCLPQEESTQSPTAPPRPLDL